MDEERDQYFEELLEDYDASQMSEADLYDLIQETGGDVRVIVR